MKLMNSIQQLAAYNTWANTQIINWLRNADNELLNEKIPSSFTTLKATFLHIYNAEGFWLSFLKKKELKPFLADFDGSNQSFFDKIISRSYDFQMHVLKLSEDMLLDEFTVNTSWLKGQKPCYIFIQHTVNHSTYHRGQLITMGRILGIDNPPNTDFTMYVINEN